MLEAAPMRRLVRLDDIPADGLEGQIEADASERAQIAQLLDLVELKELRLSYHLARYSRGRVGLKGSLDAELVQTCVVTLDPVGASVHEDIEADFWPELKIAEREAQIEDPVMHRPVDWPEPIKDGQIDLGPLTYEMLATAIDPYPRKSGGVLDWREPLSGEETKPRGPFSTLSRLKQR